MKLFIHVVSMLCISFGTTATGSENTQDSSCIKFLAGIYLINSANELTEQQKAQRYSQLVQVSGISGDSAVSFASRYYNKPDEWKKIYDKMHTILSEYDNNRKNDTIISKLNDNSTKKIKRSK